MATEYGNGARYTHVAMWLHWTMAALIVTNLFLGLFHESLLDGVGWVMPLHKSIGITVLGLTVVRIGWRLLNPPPPLPRGLPVWERGSAHAVHSLFYLAMLALPVTGWMLASGGRKYPINWFGLVEVPFLPVSKAVAGGAANAHGLLGWVMLALVTLHVLAALRHHLVLRDSVLARMAPLVARR